MTTGDKAYYDRTSTFDELTLRQMLSIHRRYFTTYQQRLRNRFQSAANVTAIELGAGTCILSLLVKEVLPQVTITALDVSLQRMRHNAPKVASLLGEDLRGIIFEEGDFSELRRKPVGSIDLILFDASLHHARSMWDLLADCRRVISKRGLLIAQREQYLGLLTSGLKLSRLLATPEVRNGVSENAYLKSQYDYYFRANGFHTDFVPCSETPWQTLALPLNGLVLSKWTILATPRASGTEG